MSPEPVQSRDTAVEKHLDEFFGEFRNLAAKLWDDAFSRKAPLSQSDQFDIAFAALCVLRSGQLPSIGFERLGELIRDYVNSDWTEAKNRRRIELIDKDVGEMISPLEAAELRLLQAKAEEHVDRTHPLPIDAARGLVEKLQAKDDRSTNGTNRPAN